MELTSILEKRLPLIGYECVDFTLNSKGILTIYIDYVDNNTNSITINDCIEVNNYLSKIFVVEHINYNRLEISSPGIDRSLKKEKDFLKYTGNLIKISIKTPINGQQVFKGKILKYSSKTLTLELKNKNILNIDLLNIDKARLDPDL